MTGVGGRRGWENRGRSGMRGRQIECFYYIFCCFLFLLGGGGVRDIYGWGNGGRGKMRRREIAIHLM